MGNFLNFYNEVMKFDDVDKLRRMQQHPFVANVTFGVEIEIIAVAVPFQDMKPEWLALGLRDSDLATEFKNPNGDDEEDDDWEEEFINYIEKNKQNAWAEFFERVQNLQANVNQYDNNYQIMMINYWSKKINPIIEASGFTIYSGKEAHGQIWAIGEDGYDSEYNMPVLEIRSGILTQNDLPKLLKVFEGLSRLYKGVDRNYPVLLATGNTGLHVHVANARTGWKDSHPDIFSRLASAQNPDEDAMWDISAGHDRNFRHATLNHPQNYEVNHEEGFHDQIITFLQSLLGNNNDITLRNIDFNMKLNNLSRRSGVNVVSEHPTVEYRYLSSMVLFKDPDKAIRFINYFITHTASMSNKDQIKFENDDMRFVLTKLPGDKIRIRRFIKKDHERTWEDELGRALPSTYKYPTTSRANRPREDLEKINQGERGDQPFKQWFYSLPADKKNSLLNRLKKP